MPRVRVPAPRGAKVEVATKPGASRHACGGGGTEVAAARLDLPPARPVTEARRGGIGGGPTDRGLRPRAPVGSSARQQRPPAANARGSL
mmetsp:Transcript_43943/g.118104  ORF Transcript_43943/g.118104 Transcript_43943/m.118104 type:complete len:89 (+) Transcript_43943:76-342(+)